VEKFGNNTIGNYLGTTLTDQNCIHEEIKSRLNLRNACYHFRSQSAVLHGCETWSLSLREQNRVLRRIFGPKRDEVAGEWRKLDNEKLHNLYSSPDIIRQANGVGRACGTHGRGEKGVHGFGGKAGRKEITRKTKT
jgi:hypothetical protein